ncbi:extracellular solute-binding protein [Rhodopirellula sp. ICT_H3.1]|uniref:Extracellular solute-binding protein n=2 Tax=Aporhodopirellula aestuarii TaxID=2950107 RepID=A0ABT0U8L3_9BACT|nr:extracellular solute-binding protein [Aporhodopirellula aestuarii]
MNPMQIRFTTSRHPARRIVAAGHVGFAFMLSAVALTVTLCGCVPRTEEDVVVYSALDEEFAYPILEAFERSVDYETSVVSKFDVESTKTVGLVNQILAEKDSPRCDVFWNNEIMHTVRLQKRGLLQRHDWPVPTDWPRDMISSDSTWCGFAARARVLLVNTKLLESDEQYPQSVNELLDPKWKDNCAMARPLFGTTATHWAVLRERLGDEIALEQLQTIADNALILSGNKQVAQAVSAGRVAWGLTDTDDAMIEKELGYPVEIVFPDQLPDQAGTLRIPNTLAVLKNAPHPVAAHRLVNYLIAPQTEDRLAMGPGSQMPISKESKFPPAVLPDKPIRWMRVDFEKAAENWETWNAQVAKIYAQR